MIIFPRKIKVRAGSINIAAKEAHKIIGRQPDVVVINDPQRATATKLFLAVARRYFNFRKTILVIATGSHSISMDERRIFLQRLGDTQFRKIVWHNSRANNLVWVGNSVGWKANPWLAAAKKILALGSVEPHYFAGFTGAHKTLTIGCASIDDIEQNHSNAMDPACRPCRTEGNPVFEGVMNMATSLIDGGQRTVAAVNLFQVGNHVYDASCGTVATALSKLTPHVQTVYERMLPSPADILIIKVMGPLATSFYQAEKGIKNNEWAVRNGGVIILVAKCPQGIGQSAFTRLLKTCPTYISAKRLVRQKGYQLGDHKAVRLRYLMDPRHRGVQVYVVSDGLTEADARVLGVQKVPSVARVLEKSRLSKLSNVVRIHDGGHMVIRAKTLLNN